MTEGDVADMWADLMHDAGAERPSFIYINSGEAPDLLPNRTKKLKRGETLWLDGGAYVGGYTCDFSRAATLGASISPPSSTSPGCHRNHGPAPR
jgi:Xaa-Pro aminopeptidase